MSIQIRLTRDQITPSLRRKVLAMRNPHRAIQAMGTALVSITKRAFADSSLRPAPWAPLTSGRSAGSVTDSNGKVKKWTAIKKGGEATLRRTGALWHSIRIVAQDDRSVTVGSDRRYAAAQQLGYPKRNLPARPFFPFTESGSPTAEASRQVAAALRAVLAKELK